MDKTYQPEKIENQWYRTWEERGYFAPSGEGDPFCIMIPPPNVTGSLHMGHAFQHTLMDALIRHRRMKGDNTLWQVGSDHAGIATQMVVERNLANDEGQTRHDLGREAFTDKIWEWETAVRGHHHQPDAPAGYLRGLGSRTLHHGRRLLPRRPGSVRAAP